ncbi:hypothetical protein BpHYR1_018006 [Brachionus plicatilis]|uniref:Uncharacterized protein n=1 Tax=Brachionus plicatilis TaxID=10195 RepID=A0A3M7PFF2_BRAPC|nr:hypothetical protein BpHYR1_018006 [Brachionus plicatilis]
MYPLLRYFAKYGFSEKIVSKSERWFLAAQKLILLSLLEFIQITQDRPKIMILNSFCDKLQNGSNLILKFKPTQAKLGEGISSSTAMKSLLLVK